MIIFPAFPRIFLLPFPVLFPRCLSVQFRVFPRGRPRRMRAGPSRHRRPPAGVRAARRRSRWSTPRLNDLDRRRAVCSARPGRRGRDGPRPHPSRLRPAGICTDPVHLGARGPAGGILFTLSCPRLTVPAAGARSRRPVSTNHSTRASTSAGAAGVPGIACSTTRDSDRGDDGADGQAQRAAAADPRREVHQGQQRLPRRGRRLVVAGDHRDRRGDRPVRPVGQVGVGLGPAPRGAQLGVGGRRGGVAGPGRRRRAGRGGWRRRSCARRRGLARRSGRGVRAGRAPRTGSGRCSSGCLRGRRSHPGRPAAATDQGPGPARGSGAGAGGGWAGGGQQGERGGPGPGDLDEGGRAALDVAGLADLQAADQVGVGGPGVLLAGGALIAPRVRR